MNRGWAPSDFGNGRNFEGAATADASIASSNGKLSATPIPRSRYRRFRREIPVPDFMKAHIAKRKRYACSNAQSSGKQRGLDYGTPLPGSNDNAKILLMKCCTTFSSINFGWPRSQPPVGFSRWFLRWFSCGTGVGHPFGQGRYPALTNCCCCNSVW